MKERRIGRFLISDELMQEYPEAVRLLWCGCIPVRVEHQWDRAVFECWAENPKFHPTIEGAECATYHVIVTHVRNDKDEIIGAIAEFDL